MNSSRKTKYIFITGGVISALGKGIAAASIGYILKSRGFDVTIQKIDPYLNVDPGTMSPYQHGEVFVLDDGSETDLDLGHYERFLDINMTKDNNTTTGMVYQHVIERERAGDYLGSTVQVVPHITNEIERRILKVGKNEKFDIVISELGGTVGDIEGLPFLEAIRQFKLKHGKDNCLNIHLTLVPYIETAGEIKTKPTQHSVKKLREIGISPDIILGRTKRHLDTKTREKISLFCNVDFESVIEAIDADSIYEIPLLFENHKLGDIISHKLDLPMKQSRLAKLRKFVKIIKNPKHQVAIGICGKYTELHDAYKSILESFIHAGVENNAEVNIKWLCAEEIANSDNPKKVLDGIHGLLIPGGFGERGIEGKIVAIRVAREQNIPFFGICLGLQCAVIEFARNVCGLEDANSTEFVEETKQPVIDLMEEQKNITDMGGTMRLGQYPAKVKKDSIAFDCYKKINISERHRHRYEINNDFLDELTENGMVVGAKNTELDLVEMIEYPNHPWFVACQFHPELKSRIDRAHPLFKNFVKATLTYKKA
ncbi:MAG: CTP synthase [Candidatus Marinimicrobia bacterium]|nr:CTP synthase [Candidatus Neomarinimicrobiota bacterium]